MSEIVNKIDLHKSGVFRAKPVRPLNGESLLDRFAYTCSVIWVTLMLISNLHPVIGSSMYPTFKNGQYVFTMRSKILPISRGEVVVADIPLFDELVIKRVAAVPGDTIRFTTDGKVYVNGKEYTYGHGSGYDNLKWDGFEKPADGSMQITLSDGEYFLLGDNRENSADSRYFGPVTRDNIEEGVWGHAGFEKAENVAN